MKIDEVEGIFTLKDLRNHLAKSGAESKEDLSFHEVQTEMTEDLTTTEPRAGIQDVAKIMRVKDIRHLPVVDEDGIIKGIVTYDDLPVGTKKDLLVRDVMEKNVRTVSLDSTIMDAVESMYSEDVTCLLISRAYECYNCGAKINPSDTRCPKCGEEIDWLKVYPEGKLEKIRKRSL